VDLLGAHEKPRLEPSHGRAAGPHRPPGPLDITQKGARRRIEAAALPSLERAGDRKKRGPEPPVDERVLSEQELREEDVGMIGQLGQDREDLARLGMRPPGGPQRFAGYERDDVRQAPVLFEQKAVAGQSLENPSDSRRPGPLRGRFSRAGHRRRPYRRDLASRPSLQLLILPSGASRERRSTQ
jgi:hypothetical protein